MSRDARNNRRDFLRTATIAAGGLILGGCELARPARPAAGPPRLTPTPSEGAIEVTPVEDLMREHGLLRRILLAYEECLRRIAAREPLPGQVLRESAEIVRSFVEDYHEKLEEDSLFPRFRQAGKLVELTETLLAQHQAGRRLTEQVLQATRPDGQADGARLVAPLREFIRMYRPHAAREDTVLFPALRTIVSAKDYDEMGDQFEDKEQALFGKEGFEKMVARVGGLEKTLAIADLADFTPKPPDKPGPGQPRPRSPGFL